MVWSYTVFSSAVRIAAGKLAAKEVKITGNAPPSDLHQRIFGEDPICGAVSYQTDSDTPNVKSRRKISCTSMRVAHLFLRSSKNMNS